VADAIFAVKLVEGRSREKAEPVGLGGTRHADAGNYIRHLFACQDVVMILLSTVPVAYAQTIAGTWQGTPARWPKPAHCA
jgi:hypothetical protein